MKLPDLLTQITPLPWIVDDRHIHASSGLTYSAGIEPETDVVLVVDTDCHHNGLLNPTDKANLEYARHATALFPELVKALEDLVNDGECYCADEMKTSCGHCLAKELLARANEIKV